MKLQKEPSPLPPQRTPTAALQQSFEQPPAEPHDQVDWGRVGRSALMGAGLGAVCSLSGSATNSWPTDYQLLPAALLAGSCGAVQGFQIGLGQTQTNDHTPIGSIVNLMLFPYALAVSGTYAMASGAVFATLGAAAASLGGLLGPTGLVTASLMGAYLGAGHQLVLERVAPGPARCTD